MLRSLTNFAVEPSPIRFCGGLGVLSRTLLYCTENVAGIHACIRGRGQGSLDPPENRRNIHCSKYLKEHCIFCHLSQYKCTHSLTHSES